MNFHRAALTVFPLFLAAAASFGQPAASLEPSFMLLLSGRHGGGSEYAFLLKQADDSGAVIVRGFERPVGRVRFYRLRKAIIECAMNLTGTNYGTPRDSADFTGSLNISALDRNTVIKLDTRVVIGTQSDSSMAVLLRLLMEQVDDSLRLQQIVLPQPAKKEKAAGTPLKKKKSPRQ